MVPGQIVVLELDCVAALLGLLVLAERTGSDSFDDRELFVLNLIVKNSVQTGLIGFISGCFINKRILKGGHFFGFNRLTSGIITRT